MKSISLIKCKALLVLAVSALMLAFAVQASASDQIPAKPARLIRTVANSPAV